MSVFVFGEAQHEADPAAEAGGFREVPMRLVISAPPGDGVLIVADQDREALLESLRRRTDLVPPA